MTSSPKIGPTDKLVNDIIITRGQKNAKEKIYTGANNPEAS